MELNINLRNLHGKWSELYGFVWTQIPWQLFGELDDEKRGMPIVQAKNAVKYENRLWDLFTEDNDRDSKLAEKHANGS